MGIRIIGSGRGIPKRKINNDYFSSYLETTSEWIEQRTGILNRYFFETKKEQRLALIKAAQEAVKNCDKEKIRLIILASMSNFDKMPIQASFIHKALGLNDNVFTIDINAACSGYVSSLALVEGYLNEGEYALVIGSERLSQMIDFNDRSTAILFGDGVGATLVEKTAGKLYKSFGTRFNQNALNASLENKNAITMEGSAVFRFATEQVIKVIDALLEQSKVRKDEVKHYIFHQANKRILDYISKKRSIDRSFIYENVAEYGNTSSASIPILLDEIIKEDKIQHGEKVIMVGFGGGLTWGGLLFEW